MLLEATHLHFSYGNQPALRDVSLLLEQGQIVALLGPNGSGKSTLLKILLGYLAGTGNIVWDGRAIAQWGRRALARKVAYLPQSPQHEVGQTVADVLRLGRAPYWGAFGLESSADDRVVLEVAKSLDLADLLQRPLDSLSGGQRQRTFIGRCLCQQPSALLLDEPDTFLDLRYQIELYAALRRLAAEKRVGILIASHDLNLAAAHADRLIVLRDGTIAASGDSQTVLRDPALEGVYSVRLERLTSQGGKTIVIPMQ